MYRSVTILIITLFTGLVLLVSRCSSPAESNLSDNKDLFLNHSDTVNYVGIETCARCHLDKVQTFIHTGMGMSIDHASREKSSAVFGPGAHVYDSFTNLNYLAHWRGEDMYIMEYRLDESGDTIHRIDQKVDYIIGSGQHTNSHLFMEGEYVYQAPMTWYSQEGKWDLPPGFEKGGNSHFTRQINVECMSCHNSMPVMKDGSDRAFVRIGTGIDCERCHGPGEMHVNFRMSGTSVTPGSRDSTIVNPSRLSADRLIDVCQRCHLQGNNVLKPGKHFTDFKPGMVLSDIFEVYAPDYEGDRSLFNMADHSQRMQMSACYKGTKGTKRQLTCISCHNPHISVKRTDPNVFNNKCRSCHTQGSDEQCTASEQVRMTENDDCVKCHMPMSGSKDIPHVRVHDHRIQIPDDDTVTKNRTLKGLYAINNPDPDDAMLIRAYLSYYEKFDPQPLYLQKAAELISSQTSVDSKIHLAYLKQDWGSIVKLGSQVKDTSQPETHYRLAKAYQRTGNYVQALLNLERAVNMDPDRPEYYNELAVVCIKLKDLQGAIRYVQRGIDRFPGNSSLLTNMGYAEYLSGEINKARSWYEHSLAIDPDHIPTLENLAQLYLSIGDMKRGRNCVERILKLQPNHAQARELLTVIDEQG